MAFGLEMRKKAQVRQKGNKYEPYGDAKKAQVRQKGNKYEPYDIKTHTPFILE